MESRDKSFCWKFHYLYPNLHNSRPCTFKKRLAWSVIYKSWIKESSANHVIVFFFFSPLKNCVFWFLKETETLFASFKKFFGTLALWKTRTHIFFTGIIQIFWPFFSKKVTTSEILKYNKWCYPLLSAHTDSWFWRPAKDGDTLSGCSRLLIRNLSWAFSPVLAGDAEVPTRPIISGKRALVKPRSVAASHLISLAWLETFQHHDCGATSQPHMGKWSCQGRVAKRLWILLLTYWSEEYNTATLSLTLRMYPFVPTTTTKIVLWCYLK